MCLYIKKQGTGCKPAPADDIVSTIGIITDPNNYVVNNTLFKWWNPKSFMYTDAIGFMWYVE